MDQSPRPKQRPKLRISFDDIKKIERVVSAEAEGEGIEGRNAIRGVILNRLMSDRFPNTVDEVLNEKGQFEPVGRYKGVENIPVDEELLNERLAEWADYIQLGKDASQGSTFFLNKELSAQRGTDFGGKEPLRIGNHTFYKGYEGQEPVTDINFSHDVEVAYDEGGFVADDLTRKFYEENSGDAKALAKAYGVEYTEPEEWTQLAKDLGQFAWESLPGIGTAYTIDDIRSEFEKEEPNYLKIGMLAGSEVAGLIPGLGSAAKNMIRKGADMARQTDEAIEIASNVPKVTRSTTPSYTDKSLLEADDIIFEWEKGNLTNPQLRKLMRDKGFEIQTKNISPKMTGDNLEVVGPDGEILRWKDMPRGKTGPSVADIEADVVEAERLLDDPDAMKAWQEQNKLPETQRQSNPEDSKLAAEQLFEGEITSKEARQRISDAIPSPQEYTAEQVRDMMPTVTEVTGSLGKKASKYGIIGVKGFDLEAGQEISSRLDIPAYNTYDTWVVSIHDGTKDAGPVVGFGQAIRLENIKFGSKSKDALDIARGKRTTAAGEDKPMGKATIARIFGEYVPQDPKELQEIAAQIIESGSDEWTQVGMNPYRGSAFYDKKTGMPVFEADEVIQVGPLVLAKNVKKPTISQMKEMAVRTRDGKLRMFNEGGIAMDEQMDAVFKSSRTGYAVGGEVDPVSGNEVPTGSLPEEVRDDIPAQLSEGEYVVPADVVRYYGVKFFEDLRTEAKVGWQNMEQNGRIGGTPVAPEGMEMGGDELPFDISELQISDSDEQPMMNAGGYMRGYAPGGFADYGNNSLITVVEYVNDAGESIWVQFMGDKPLTIIPEGFRPADTAAEEVAKNVQEQTVEASTSDDGGDRPPVNTPEPIDWKNTATVEDFNNYLSQKESTLNKVVQTGAALVGGLPMMGLMKAAIKMEDKRMLSGLEAQIESLPEGDPKRVQLEEIKTRIGSSGEVKSSKPSWDTSADKNTTGYGIFGGQSTLKEGLTDVSGDGRVSFADTWLGDFLGIGPNNDFGIEKGNPGLSASIGGARRNNTGGSTPGGVSSGSTSNTSSSPSIPATSGTKTKSFSEAFKEARTAQGSGGTFEWNGNKYSTNYASEASTDFNPDGST